MGLFPRNVYSEYEARKRALERDGYKPGNSSPEAAQIDSIVCAASTCLGCQHEGLEYHPLVNWQAASSVVLAVCPNCGYTVQI